MKPFKASIWTLMFLTLAACSPPRTQVRRAQDEMASCCAGLPDAAARDACLREIPGVPAEAERSRENEATFACVSRHFQCDPATGRATRDSVQEQYDCLAALE